MNYKQLLLNRLLDKYERSKAYLKPEEARKRIILSFKESEFPEYDIENANKKALINSIVEEMFEKDLVGIKWVKHNEGNLLSSIWIRLDHIDEIYKEAKRISKKAIADSILKEIRNLKNQVYVPWILNFFAQAEKEIEARKKITPLFPDDLLLSKGILKALKSINDKGEEELLERVFSLRTFGDSKYFEKEIRSRIVSLIRKNYLYEETIIEPPNDEEVLAQVGIVKAPEQIDFCGGLLGYIEGKKVDFSVFTYGISINSLTVKSLEKLYLEKVDRILFIENKANFVDYVAKYKKSNELVIFHGGFYSPVKGLFFQNIYDVGKIQGAAFYHWSDIDVGGFRIFHRLKKNIIPTLQPYLMDKEAFLSKKGFWKDFDLKYGEILRKMLESEDYLQFHEVIKEMLKERARLEQEAFL